MKKFVSLTMAMLLTVALTVPVFAASPTTDAVPKTSVTITTQIAAAKGYVLTAEEQALIATTLEQALALASGVLADANGVPLTATAASPELIALAKADILKNPALIKALKLRGVTGAIANAGMLASADGAVASKPINLTTTGLVPGQKAAIVFYLPGNATPHVARTSWKNGKLQATLPLPCIYNIVK